MTHAASVKLHSRVLRDDVARPSVYLQLGDEGFQQRFTEIWEEHIEGFVGLSRRAGKSNNPQAAEKKMEWQLRLEAKKRQREDADLAAKTKRRRRMGMNTNNLASDDDEAPIRGGAFTTTTSSLTPSSKKGRPSSNMTVSPHERALVIEKYRALVVAKRRKVGLPEQ
jgi:hypothetical protein